MWRKITETIRQTVSRKPLKNVVVNHPTANSILTPNVVKTPAQVAAEVKLKESLVGMARPEPKTVTAEQIITLSKRPLTELNEEQLVTIGNAYFSGIENELEPNDSRAFEIWKEASRKGSLEAKYNAAMMRREGKGTDADAAEAFKGFLELAKEHNIGIAQYNVGLMYFEGEGVEKNQAEAFKYFQKAAANKVSQAWLNIANAYAAGSGVAQSDKDAIKFYNVAIAAGDPVAKYNLGTWYYTGRGGLPVDKVKSFQLQYEAAHSEHSMAMFNIGSAFLMGEGTEQNAFKALQCFEQAAARGVVPAVINLAIMYKDGVGVPQDLQKALEVFAPFIEKNEVCRTMHAEIQKLIEEQQA